VQPQLDARLKGSRYREGSRYRGGSRSR